MASVLFHNRKFVPRIGQFDILIRFEDVKRKNSTQLQIS